MLLIVRKISLYKYNILYSFNLNNTSINTFNYNPNSFAQNNETAESIPTTRLLTITKNRRILMQGYAVHVVQADNEFL